MVKTIGNPMSFVVDVLRRGTVNVGDGLKELKEMDDRPIEIRGLQTADLSLALRKGFDDFAAMRTDVMFIVLVYPVIGLMLTWFVFNQELLPLLFPLMSGFALLGPVFAVGLYEMSRRREAGLQTGWSYAFSVVKSPSTIPIVLLGGVLSAVFLAWVLMASVLYRVTLGPDAPLSAMAFVTDVFTTNAGWVMLIAGLVIGGIFAAAVLAISVVSFPLLLDRNVGLTAAVATSVKVTLQNPIAVMLWGAIVVGLLGLATVTLFVGLIFVLPILGHATWHLYRQAILRPQ